MKEHEKSLPDLLQILASALLVPANQRVRMIANLAGEKARQREIVRQRLVMGCQTALQCLNAEGLSGQMCDGAMVAYRSWLVLCEAWLLRYAIVGSQLRLEMVERCFSLLHIQYFADHLDLRQDTSHLWRAAARYAQE